MRDWRNLIHIVVVTHYTQADVDMADRHIAEGEQHIVRQEELLSRLRMQSLPTSEAEKLLAIFNATMVEHRTHRVAIIEALKADGL